MINLNSFSNITNAFRNVLKGQSAVRSAFQIFLNQGGVFVIGFLASVLLARVLGPEDRGLLAEILVYPALVGSFLQMGIRQSVVYETGRGHYSVEALVGNVLSLLLAFSIIGIVLSIGLIRYSSVQDYRMTDIILASIPLIFVLIKSYAGGLFLGQQRIGQFNNTELLPSVIRLLGILVFVWFFAFGVTGALAATLLSSVVATVYVIKVILRDVRITPMWNWGIVNALFQRGIVYALAILLTQLNYKIDIVLLGRLASAEEVGFYSVAVAIPMLIWQIPSAAGLVIFSRRANVGKNAAFGVKVRRAMLVCLGLGFLVSVVLYFIAPYLISLVYGNSYEASTTMFQLILPGVVGMIGYKVLGFDFAGMGRPWLPVLITAPGLGVNFVLNLLWIPSYGGNGAALASAVSYVLILVISMLIFYRVSKQEKLDVTATP